MKFKPDHVHIEYKLVPNQSGEVSPHYLELEIGITNAEYEEYLALKELPSAYLEKYQMKLMREIAGDSLPSSAVILGWRWAG